MPDSESEPLLGETSSNYDGTIAEQVNVAIARGNISNGPQSNTENGNIQTYLSRFWILLIFSVIGCVQCVEWNTWGPISQSVEAAFPGWDSSTVAMMGNWGTITFVLFIFPICYLMQTKGVRAAVLIAVAFMAVGTLLRCLTLQTPAFTILCHLCAILVGTAGTVAMAAPPLIAVLWFPPKERTTAVAFSQAFGQFGTVVSYLQPLIVRAPGLDTSNDEIRSDISRLMFITAGVTGLLFVAVTLYFPSTPPKPPSISSTLVRFEFLSALKSLFRKKQFVFILVSYSIFLGIPSTWMSVLNYSFLTFGMQQSEAMWVGIISTLCSCVTALLVGRFTDRFYGHVKTSLLILMGITIMAFVWFMLLTVKYFPPEKWSIFASIIIGLSANYATSPLYFELAVEMGYPASEAVTGGVVTCGNNLVGIFFLFIFFVKFETYTWVTFCLVGGCVVSVFPLLFVKEEYARSSIDRSDSLSSSRSSIYPTSSSCELFSTRNSSIWKVHEV